MFFKSSSKFFHFLVKQISYTENFVSSIQLYNIPYFNFLCNKINVIYRNYNNITFNVPPLILTCTKKFTICFFFLVSFNIFDGFILLLFIFLLLCFMEYPWEISCFPCVRVSFNSTNVLYINRLNFERRMLIYVCLSVRLAFQSVTTHSLRNMPWHTLYQMKELVNCYLLMLSFFKIWILSNSKF